MIGYNNIHSVYICVYFSCSRGHICTDYLTNNLLNCAFPGPMQTSGTYNLVSPTPLQPITAITVGLSAIYKDLKLNWRLLIWHEEGDHCYQACWKMWGLLFPTRQSTENVCLSFCIISVVCLPSQWAVMTLSGENIFERDGGGRAEC